MFLKWKWFSTAPVSSKNHANNERARNAAIIVPTLASCQRFYKHRERTHVAKSMPKTKNVTFWPKIVKRWRFLLSTKKTSNYHAKSKTGCCMKKSSKIIHLKKFSHVFTRWHAPCIMLLAFRKNGARQKQACFIRSKPTLKSGESKWIRNNLLCKPWKL